MDRSALITAPCSQVCININYISAMDAWCAYAHQRLNFQCHHQSNASKQSMLLEPCDQWRIHISLLSGERQQLNSLTLPTTLVGLIKRIISTGNRKRTTRVKGGLIVLLLTAYRPSQLTHLAAVLPIYTCCEILTLSFFLFLLYSPYDMRSWRNFHYEFVFAWSWANHSWQVKSIGPLPLEWTNDQYSIIILLDRPLLTSLLPNWSILI